MMKTILTLTMICSLGFAFACRSMETSRRETKDIILYGDISAARQDEIIRHLQKSKLLRHDRIQFIRNVGPDLYEIRTDRKAISLEKHSGAWNASVALWQSSTTSTITPDGKISINKELKHPHPAHAPTHP